MATTYTLISSNVLTVSNASVTFSSIPQTYTDLVIKISGRTDRTAQVDSLAYTINGSSAANYSVTRLTSNGSLAGSAFQSNATSAVALNVLDASQAVISTFGTIEIYIPNYNVLQNKQMSLFGAQEMNASQANMNNAAILYRDTTAITSLTFTSANSFQFVPGSSFYLYGIKKN